MEPPHVRGGMPRTASPAESPVTLQWSRRMFAAEWCDDAGAPQVPAWASMEPPHVRGGMWYGGSVYLRNPSASMEPPHVCGGMAWDCAFAGDSELRLQWSRRMFAAECRPRCRDVRARHALQWRRRMFAAECRAPDLPRRARWRRFNGAAACSQRNVLRPSSVPTTIHASMGP